jgi:hypothetical protein
VSAHPAIPPPDTAPALVPVDPDVTDPLASMSHTQLRLRLHVLLEEVAAVEEALRERSRGPHTPPRTAEQVERSRRSRLGLDVL